MSEHIKAHFNYSKEQVCFLCKTNCLVQYNFFVMHGDTTAKPFSKHQVFCHECCCRTEMIDKESMG